MEIFRYTNEQVINLRHLICSITLLTSACLCLVGNIANGWLCSAREQCMIDGIMKWFNLIIY